jgi:uncharacterized protein YkwD
MRRTLLTSGLLLGLFTAPMSAQNILWSEPAETTNAISWQTTGNRSPLVDSPRAQGLKAFALTTDFSQESIVLNPSPGPTITPGPKTKLYFQNLLGYRTATQIATVQYSTNNSTWTTLWTATNSPMGNYNMEIVDLSSLAGQNIRLRWHFLFTGVSAYTWIQDNPPVGWFFDDILIADSLQIPSAQTVGEPTAKEVAMVWFINRARADAQAEAARLASTTDPQVRNAMTSLSVNTNMMITQFNTLQRFVPPVAINTKLTQAARLHSQDMLVQGFQDHTSSSSPPPPNQAGDTSGNRVSRQGYLWQYIEENIYAYATTPWMAHAAFNIDWGYGPGGMQSPPGHRLAIHNPIHREIGVGVYESTARPGFGPMGVTHEFAQPSQTQPLLCGTAWKDTNTNNTYDPGEGLGGVTISVPQTGLSTTTSTHGAYSLPILSPGSFEVTFTTPSGDKAIRTITRTNAANLTNNVLADYLGEMVRIGTTTLRQSPRRIELQVLHTGPTAKLRLKEYNPTNGTWTNAGTNIPAPVSSGSNASIFTIPLGTNSPTGFWKVEGLP